jgi:hypothetical protein
VKRLFTTTILLCIIIVLAHAQASEEKLVRKSFENYKKSILNDKGEEAVKYVDKRTIKYYGDMLELVKNADSVEVESLSILDKLMVFTIRHRASKDDILRFDGKKLFVYAIESGMVGKSSVATNSVGEVIINDNFAKGQFIMDGKKVPFYFHFYKEEGQWKIDLTSLFPTAMGAFDKMAEESELSENEFLFFVLEIATGKKPGNEIWSPIK